MGSFSVLTEEENLDTDIRRKPYNNRNRDYVCRPRIQEDLKLLGIPGKARKLTLPHLVCHVVERVKEWCPSLSLVTTCSR